ncbi:homoserine O- acetyltransferase [Massospora cicadina]|nr:homoserine O- acetyltransferase [Massospora cicadina]
MVICHALTGSSDVSDWWGALLGPGKAFDPTRFFIFCGNVLGSPYGTASPCTRNPSTGKRYGPDFPATTIRDDVRIHKLVLDSMARIQALLTYRTAESFQTRFARERASNLASVWAQGEPAKPFLAQSYLKYQGEKFVSRFDANCYIKLIEKMDSYDLGVGRKGYELALKSIEQPTLIIGIESDGLFKVAEQKELARFIPKAALEFIESADGHDAFLIEFMQLNRILLSFIDRHLGHFKPGANEGQTHTFSQPVNSNGASLFGEFGDGLVE